MAHMLFQERKEDHFRFNQNHSFVLICFLFVHNKNSIFFLLTLQNVKNQKVGQLDY